MSVRSMVGGGVQERWKVSFTTSPVSLVTLPGGPTKEGECCESQETHFAYWFTYKSDICDRV